MGSRTHAALPSLGAAAVLVRALIAALATVLAPALLPALATVLAPALLPTPLIAQATAAAVDAAAHHVDRAQLMRDVEALSAPAFEGRRTGTPGALKARQWLVDQFSDIGLASGGTEGYVQPFTFRAREDVGAGRGGRPGAIDYAADYAAANVIGRIPGRDTGARTVVVTAHYDHLGIRDGVAYPGADDNASRCFWPPPGTS